MGFASGILNLTNSPLEDCRYSCCLFSVVLAHPESQEVNSFLCPKYLFPCKRYLLAECPDLPSALGSHLPLLLAPSPMLTATSKLPTHLFALEQSAAAADDVLLATGQHNGLVGRFFTCPPGTRMNDHG
ncbi:unnamed protein product [Protopolystoma xenopodis]|uniref:Uncharacterized protein n=1 Tax=Protopolystoma xenopodis TaxID=117903 RepID=A0A3S5BSW4_9PLAT|nr:unnamed protein product [Protopolystoma xenopodis]